MPKIATITEIDDLPEVLDAIPRDPANIGFPAMLPMELAMKVDTPANICKAYNISKAQFSDMVHHPVFIKAYQEAVEALKVHGMSFKVKAQMQAESYLGVAHGLITNPRVSEAVRADLIKNTVRWAGYDAKAVDVGTGNSFNIQINLGDSK